MRIQSINMLQQPDFCANLPKSAISKRSPVIPKRDCKQETNYIQAIMVGLAFFAASLTKTLIDTFKNNDSSQTVAETSAIQQTVTPDAKTYQLK